MKRLTLALLCLAACASSHATPARPDTVKRYIVLTHAEAMMTQTLNQPTDLQPLIAQFEPDPEKQQAIRAASEEILKRFRSRQDPHKLAGLLEQAVAQVFNEEELQAASRFYTTPEGQSMLKKTPEFVQQLMRSVMPVLYADLAASVREVAAQADRNTLDPATATP